MAFITPSTPKEITDRIKSDIKNNLPNSNPFLKNSLLGVLVDSLGLRILDFYKQVELGLIPELFPDTATGENLERLGSIVNITRKQASKSIGKVIFIGEVGSIIPIGTELQSSNGLVFLTSAESAIVAQNIAIASISESSGIATVTTSNDHNLGTGLTLTISGCNQVEFNGEFKITVLSKNTFSYTVNNPTTSTPTGTKTAILNFVSVEVESQGYGKENNLVTGDVLNLSESILSVESEVYIDYLGFVGGVDIESDEFLRTRIINRYKFPVTNFNKRQIIDYVLSVSGVTRCWVLEATPNLGYVTVYFVLDNESSILPNQSKIDEVKNKILEIKPVNIPDDHVVVLAPTLVQVNFSFSSISPNTQGIKNAITDNLKQFFIDRSGLGNDILEDLYRSVIINTLDENSGDFLNSFTLTSPSGNLTADVDEILTLGIVTF